MDKYALIGHPLGHTMSPPIHNRLFGLEGRKAGYEVFEIAPEDLKSKAGQLFELNGFNVTIPHKINIIPFLDKLDSSAEKYGAVNVVDCKTKTGYNTDVYGFVGAVESLGASLASKVLLLGCGGAGRMMAVETAFSGGELTIAVRKEDIKTAEQLKTEIEQKTNKSPKVTLLSDSKGNFDLLLNATPVGMYPNINACAVEEEIIKNCSFVFDAVYNPKKTKLIKTAEQYSIPAGGGMTMLVLQAVRAHEIWNGAEYKNEDIKQLISEMSVLAEKFR